MRKIRPSLHKLEKSERKAGDIHGATVAAQALVYSRIRSALDRISVAAQFREFTGAVPAQLGHAQRFIRFGGPGEVETLGSPVVGEEDAADLVRILSNTYHDALVAELLARAALRDAGESEAAS